MRRGPDTLELETMHVSDLPEVRDADATVQAAREALDTAAARLKEIYDTLETPIPKPDAPTPGVSRLDRLRARLAKGDAEAKRDLAEADLEQATATLATVTEAARHRIRAARRPAEDRLRQNQFRRRRRVE